jgi:hypothetical protein
MFDQTGRYSAVIVKEAQLSRLDYWHLRYSQDADWVAEIEFNVANTRTLAFIAGSEVHVILVASQMQRHRQCSVGLYPGKLPGRREN